MQTSENSTLVDVHSEPATLAGAPQYSIVIPAYNEDARIESTLKKIRDFIALKNWDAEVIVVNDGSSDETVSIVEKYAKGDPRLKLVDNHANRGKGFSVKNGMLHAAGEILLFSDADLSSPIEEGLKLFEAISQGADVAIGSRWVQAKLQIQRQPLHRQIFGRIFNRLLRTMLALPFKDTQCGFKAFTRRAAQAIFPLQQIEGWGFDPEVLFLARRLGFKIVEVPVAWAHREGTRISPLSDGPKMLFEMMTVWWNALTGKYPKRPQAE
jgi:dolichyl-phosphate beta-glucosyltransferase